jgi:hypothetical protein
MVETPSYMLPSRVEPQSSASSNFTTRTSARPSMLSTAARRRRPGKDNERAALRGVEYVMPAALMIYPCPGAMRDGLDALVVAHEKVPGIFARGDDCFVAVPDQPTELVAAEIIPDVLHWVEFR